MNSRPPEQLPARFLNLNWDQAMDSAFSSIVSSHASNSPAGTESLAFHKFLGGMQSMGSNGGEEISPQSHYLGTPMSSPPELNLFMLGRLNQQLPAMAGLPPLLGSHMPLANLDQLAVDQGFAERAVRFSNFDGRNYSQLVGEFGVQNGRISKAGSSPSTEMSAPPGKLQQEMSNGIEESSVSDPAGTEFCLAGTAGNNSKKRKAVPVRSRGKYPNSSNSAANNSKVVAEETSSDAKRSRNENDSGKAKIEQNESVNGSGDGGQKPVKESNVKSPEPPKDYIHVRARRGQATDSHSLAERVRREKISQRMKLLQDIVPGCNKVTGKAVMLDEIINYVQSLQRQVEFLSMKLATVNPRLDFNNLASLFPKDMPQTCGPVPNSIFPLETSGMASSYANQPQQGTSLHCVLNNGIEAQNSLNLPNPAFHQNLNDHQPFLTTFENAQSQLAAFWDNDLHNVVQMDMGQNPDIAVASQSFSGSLPTTHMKTEL